MCCLDACERYHVFTKKVHYQTTGRGVRCFESSASIKGIGIVESYGRRWRVAQLSYVEWPAVVWTRHSASVWEDASPLVHSACAGQRSEETEDTASRQQKDTNEVSTYNYSHYKNVQTVT